MRLGMKEQASWRGGISKISDEGHHLKSSYTHKIKPMKRALKTHSKFDRVSFLFQNSMYQYMRQGTLFIGKGGMMGKLSKGRKGKGRGGQGGLTKVKTAPLARSSRR